MITFYYINVTKIIKEEKMAALNSKEQYLNNNDVMALAVALANAAQLSDKNGSNVDAMNKFLSRNLKPNASEEQFTAVIKTIVHILKQTTDELTLNKDALNHALEIARKKSEETKKERDEKEALRAAHSSISEQLKTEKAASQSFAKSLHKPSEFDLVGIVKVVIAYVAALFSIFTSVASLLMCKKKEVQQDAQLLSNQDDKNNQQTLQPSAIASSAPVTPVALEESHPDQDENNDHCSAVGGLSDDEAAAADVVADVAVVFHPAHLAAADPNAVPNKPGESKADLPSH
ncbi:MAG: hypothetical protein EBX40_02825 [Gammaproteobacteria bacterium]|nr:hypothetical protein [Gammaproteobacteria bacterium]